MKIGFYPMVGDLLHAGHILAIQEARSKCDYLIIGLNVNPNGKDPVQSTYERYIQLRALRDVDEIIPYEGKSDMENLVRSLHYDIRFVGDDYRSKTWDGKDSEEELKKEVVFLSRNHGFSSTELKKRVYEKVKK